MNHFLPPPVGYDGRFLTGNAVEQAVKTIKDVRDIFSDAASGRQLPDERVVYEVASYLPVPQGTSGGLFFGITYIHPGTVGNEYFMTRGHFHQLSDRAEYYWCIEGEGMLILMDRQRSTRAERMYQGSLHYIDAGIAHRTANTGSSILSFGACWPADAGYDYESISRDGFSKILINDNGSPALIDRPLIQEIR